MRPPRSKTSRSSSRGKLKKMLLLMSAVVAMQLLMMEEEECEEYSPRNFVRRERRSWATYVRPMLADGTFRKRFRMNHVDFKVLVEMLRPKLTRDAKMGALRNGAVPVEFQVAMALRYMAGGSIFEVMDGHVIARSTAYMVVHRVVDALNQCRTLDCQWPSGGEVDAQANLFQTRSTNDVIRRAVGAMDGLFLRLTKPSIKVHRNSKSFYSGHKKGYGMNFQAICNARYEIIGWTMNCTGSTNDRTAWKHSGFQTLVDNLPEGFYILGDAAYPPSDRVLVPFPGTALTISQDAYNFYQSQCRISIEQTFGIMVRTWGILWRPCEVRLDRFSHVINAVVRLHNFCRRRRVPVPPTVGVAQPKEVSFDERGRIDCDFFEPSRPLGRTPANPSGPREAIRARLEAETTMRPRWNLERNADRWPVV